MGLVMVSCSLSNTEGGVKVLPSGVKIKGSYTPEDADYFDKAFNRFASSYEKEDLDRLMGLFSDTFSDRYNDKSSLRKRMKKLFARYRDIRFMVRHALVVVEEDSASSDLLVEMTAKSSDGKSDVDVKSRYRLFWQKKESIWKIEQMILIKRHKE